ncbi:hypothetical protein Tco_0475910, partial [Tanacetum coccineum]
QAIQTFLTDKANLGSPTKRGRKDKPHVISYCRFTKLIICHLGRIHNIHQRSTSPFHLAEEDLRLGNLKFIPKGEEDEHDQKVTAEKEGENKSTSTKQPKPKPAIEKSSKPAPAPKPKVTKEKPSKASTAKPPKPKPAKEKSTKATPLQKAGKGKVAKVRNVKSSFQLVDEPDEEPAHSEPEPEHQGEGEEFDMEREAIRPLPVRVEARRTPATKEASTGPSTQPQDDTAANIVCDSPSPADAETRVESDKTNSRGDIEILQIAEEIGEDVTNQVQESLNFSADEHVIIEDPLSATGTLSSMKNLEDAYAIGDQFINDKSTDDEQEYSMVGSNLTTTTTTPLPPPPQQQSTTKSELAERVTTLEKKLSDLEQTNKNLDNTTRNLGSRVYTLELRDLPHKIDEAVHENVKEVVQITLQAPLRDRFRDLSEEAMGEFLDEKDKSYKRRRDDQDPLPPPPDSDLSKRRRHDTGASGLHHTSSSSVIRYYFQLDERPATPEPAWVIPTSHITDVENNLANALASTYQAPVKNSLLEKTRDMRTFMNWYCQKIGKTELTHADLEGQAYEVIDWANPEGDQVRIDISKPLPFNGPPVVFPVSNNEWKIMRFNEIYKFSDGTLTNIMEALDYRVKEYKVNRLNPVDSNMLEKLRENVLINHKPNGEHINAPLESMRDSVSVCYASVLDLTLGAGRLRSSYVNVTSSLSSKVMITRAFFLEMTSLYASLPTAITHISMSLLKNIRFELVTYGPGGPLKAAVLLLSYPDLITFLDLGPVNSDFVKLPFLWTLFHCNLRDERLLGVLLRDAALCGGYIKLAQLFSASGIWDVGMTQAGSGVASLSSSGIGFNHSGLCLIFGRWTESVSCQSDILAEIGVGMSSTGCSA